MLPVGCQKTCGKLEDLQKRPIGHKNFEQAIRGVRWQTSAHWIHKLLESVSRDQNKPEHTK